MIKFSLFEKAEKRISFINRFHPCRRESHKRVIINIIFDLWGNFMLRLGDVNADGFGLVYAHAPTHTPDSYICREVEFPGE